MKTMTLILTCALALALGTGCKDDKKAAPSATPAATTNATTNAAATPSPTKTAAGADGKVVVPKEGKVFKPPVQKSQIPDGAWYCDMGTVEYARMDKGDGKCPECGMMLKQMGAKAAAPAAHDHEHGHGHDHKGGEGHDHKH